jgi:hypothetical protein
MSWYQHSASLLLAAGRLLAQRETSELRRHRFRTQT